MVTRTAACISRAAKSSADDTQSGMVTSLLFLTVRVKKPSPPPQRPHTPHKKPSMEDTPSPTRPVPVATTAPRAGGTSSAVARGRHTHPDTHAGLAPSPRTTSARAPGALRDAPLRREAARGAHRRGGRARRRRPRSAGLGKGERRRLPPGRSVHLRRGAGRGEPPQGGAMTHKPQRRGAVRSPLPPPLPPKER